MAFKVKGGLDLWEAVDLNKIGCRMIYANQDFIQLLQFLTIWQLHAYWNALQFYEIANNLLSNRKIIN